MSVGAASRIHYWKHHPEVMLAGQAKREWTKKATARGRRKRTGGRSKRTA
jgi:hypothetical protein